MNIPNPFQLPFRAAALSLTLGGAVFGAVASAPVVAQPAGAASGGAKAPISVQLQAFKVVRDGEGKEQLQSAGRAKPGDVLEYRATYVNNSQKEVKNLQATLPIPASTEVLLDSANPKAVNASSDGRNFAPAPLVQTVTLPNGSTQKRALPASAYRALRWPVGTLAAGQNVVVRARVRLNSTFAAQ